MLSNTVYQAIGITGRVPPLPAVARPTKTVRLDGSDPLAFAAARVGLGALGVLTRVRLRCVPAFRLLATKRKMTLDACLADVERLKAAHRRFEFFWLPHADQVQAKTLDETDAPAEGQDLLFELVRDRDEVVAAEAMELVIARSRRFDRFQEPDMGQVELPAELQHKLVWLVAASLRHYIVQQHGLAAVDGVIEEAGSALIASHDEGTILEAHAARLAQRLARTGRLDGAILVRILSEGMLPLFIAGAATLCGLEHAAAWEVIADPRGRGPAILLRAAGIEREEAAAILLLANSRGPLVSGAEGDATLVQLELYDSLDRGSAEEVLRLWRAAPGYRAAVARVSTRARPAPEAA